MKNKPKAWGHIVLLVLGVLAAVWLVLKVPPFIRYMEHCYARTGNFSVYGKVIVERVTPAFDAEVKIRIYAYHWFLGIPYKEYYRDEVIHTDSEGLFQLTNQSSKSLSVKSIVHQDKQLDIFREYHYAPINWLNTSGYGSSPNNRQVFSMDKNSIDPTEQQFRVMWRRQ